MPAGSKNLVADKGYHSNEVVRTFAGIEVRTYIAEPERGKRNWEGKQAEKQAVYANRRRIQGERGKRMQRARGEKIERNLPQLRGRTSMRGHGENGRVSTLCRQQLAVF